jgi:acetyl-CoA carboxylase carboxyltransferase component
MKPTDSNRQTEKAKQAVDKKIKSKRIRPDLANVIERHSFGLDEHRPEAVKRMQEKNRRTARTNVMELCDPDSFMEYGALTIAAQRLRRSSLTGNVKIGQKW